MSLEVLSILLSGVAAVTGVATVCLSVRHNRQRSMEREEDRRLVEEQLELAREQSEMRPHLRVTNILLLDPENLDAMEGSVDPPWMFKLRNLRGASPLSVVSTFLQQGRLLDKTIGEKVVVVWLGNDGKTAAHLVTGWIRLDATHLEPTNPSGGTSVSLEHGQYSVAFVGEDAVALAPGRSLSFRVIVAVHATGTTRIGYDFTSYDGRGPEGSQEVAL